MKETVKGLATQETVSAMMETVAETKEGMTELTGLMQDMLEELTATHEDVRHVRTTVTTLANTDASQDAAIKTLTARVHWLERNVGLTSGAFRPCDVHQA